MMNSLKWTSIDLVVDASPRPLASGINSELSLLPLVSIGWSIHASFVSAISRSQVHMTSHP
jgi:hypothetical protein